MASNVYKITVSPGKDVFLRELTLEEFEACVQLAGDKKIGWDTAMHGIRRSIVAIGDQQKGKIGYQDLIGNKLGALFTVREIQMLMLAWNRIHSPTEEEGQAGVKAMEVIAG